MVSIGPVQIANPEGLWALLAIVPLILLYLIRPRPKPVQIPSLMFFMKSRGAKKLTSFFKTVTKDWLFLIQLLALLALALTIADPFTTYQHDITAENTVVVLDVSASMQTREGGRTRFSKAVSEAKGSLGASNTLILAKDVPYLALQDVSSQEIYKYLNSLQPKTTTSQIGEAIILAGETLSEGRVIVLSDFINTGGQDPEIAKSVLESKGLVVDFVNVAEEGKTNIGIIDMIAGNEETTIYVKNYDTAAHTTTLQIGRTQSQLNIPAQSIETYSFQTPPGITKIELKNTDDLIVDNTAWLSAPSQGKAKVLLITNNQSVFLKNALLASGEIELQVTEPPVVPKGNYDITIIQNIDREELLPGTFEDINENLKDGGAVIVHVQEDSTDINYKGLMPVKIGEKTEGGFISVDQLNQFTKNIEFGATDTAYSAEPKDDAVQIVSVTGTPLIVLQQKGPAKYMYYGIPEDAEFKYSTSYPIFWTELIKHLTSQQDVRNLNYKAGETLILEKEQEIQTPSKKVRKSALVLDEAGLYQLEDRTIAVNLLNELESDINAKESEGTRSQEYELKPVKETREFPWAIALLIFAIAILLFEMLFVKMRGEL